MNILIETEKFNKKTKEKTMEDFDTISDEEYLGDLKAEAQETQNNVKLKDKKFEILYGIKNKLDEEIEEFILDQNIMYLQIKELKQIHKNILKVLNIKSLDDSKYFKFKNLRKFCEKNLYQRNIDILCEIEYTLKTLETEKKDKDKVEYTKEKDNIVKQIQSIMLMLKKEQEVLTNNFSQMQDELEALKSKEAKYFLNN